MLKIWCISLFYFTVDGTTNIDHRNGQGYFQVKLELIFSDGNDGILTQECTTCQSVLSKSLGPISERLSRLEVAYYSGYNMTVLHQFKNFIIHQILHIQ